jgi:acetyl-CoA carboxylase carboxyl transferase subunit alpha
VIGEPLGGAHRDTEAMLENLRKALTEGLSAVREHSLDTLLNMRFQRLMGYGKYKETRAR